MSQTFDAAAFRAALKAASQRKPKAITIPGVGPAFKRELTVADVDEAQALRRELAEKHPQLNARRLNIAIGLGQTLCGPEGERLFDLDDPADIELLASMPWSLARGVTADEEGDEKNG